MALFSGRTGRRRRVMNEEVLSASSAHLALRSAGKTDDSADDAPRYSDAASVENHPQVTDFVPRRYRTLAMMALVGVASTAVLEALHMSVSRLSAALGPWATAAVDLTASGSLAAWLSAMLMAVASVACLLVYSLRRHKIADFRGRYRIWLAAAVACLLMSVDSVAAMHRLVAETAAHFAPWTALRGNALWWLVLGGIPLTWIALRMLMDVWESRLATSALVLSIAAYVAATLSYLGWLSALDAATEPMVTVGATLIGHWMLLVAVVTYARFVVLDAQGLIPVRTTRQASRKASGAARNDSQAHEEAKAMGQRYSRTASEGQESDEEESIPFSTSMKSFRRQMKGSKQAGQSSQTQWVDGSEPSVEEDEDDGRDSRQRLSKADRKRMRKMRQDRAA